MTSGDDAYDVAERAVRDNYGKLLAYLAARCGDVHAAEDALADAFASALERWREDGVPRSPAAWLLVAARNRLSDNLRRMRTAERLNERLSAAFIEAERDVARSGGVGDERVAMLFACAHPAIAENVRAPLMLQVVLGLDAARIASAFLVKPQAMGQRLVRAKRKISEARIPLRVPEWDELPDRLDAVLEAIYTAFSGAWDDPGGSDPRLRGLASEAIWLGRMVVDSCPEQPEAIGLLALMLHADARRSARRDEHGGYVPLEAQDPARWDPAAIIEAEALLERAAAMGNFGRFQLEAAIQSAHAARRWRGATDWESILVLYNHLLRMTGSPVVALNRAVAIGRSRLRGSRPGGPGGAELRSALGRLSTVLGGTRHMLSRAGDMPAARSAYERAMGLSIDPAARCYLARRMTAAAGGTRI